MRTHLYKFIFIVISLCTLATTNAWAKYVYIDVTKLQFATEVQDKDDKEYYNGEYYVNNLRVHYGGGYFVTVDPNTLQTVYDRKIYKVEIPETSIRWQISTKRKNSEGSVFYHPTSSLTYDDAGTYVNKYIIKKVAYVANDSAVGEVAHMIGFVTGGLIYFDNSKTNWSAPIQMVIGHGSYARTYNLKQIKGTNLWYVNLTNTDARWPDATYFAFINTQKAHILGGTTPEQAVLGGTNHGGSYGNTDIYRTQTELANGQKYLFIPTTKDDKTPITCQTNIPNFTITQNVKIRDYEGADYKTITNNFPATFTLTTHTLNTDDTTAVAKTNSGTSTLTSQSVYKGRTTFSYTNPNETNFKFDAWGTGGPSALATNTLYANNYEKATTMYAFFTRKYAFSFSAQTGGTMTAKVGTTTLSSGTRVVGDTITLIASPNNGYEFSKWVDANGTELSTSTTYKHILNADITIKAVFAPKKYTITFDRQGGTGGTGSITATYLEIVPNITNPTRTGYTFGGYWTGKNGTGTQYYNQDGGAYDNKKWDQTDNTTLYAKWTANTNTPYVVKHYQQNLDGLYPSNPTDTDNLTGTTAASITPSVKSYQGFTAPSTQTVTIAADGSTVVTYLYTRKTFTLSWNLSGGNALTGNYTYGSVKFEAPITKPNDPTRNGYVFLGWSPEVPATMPAANATYTAQWGKAVCENQYTFHTGNADVWNNPTEKTCFERKHGTTNEWEILNYLIPTGDEHTHFLVGYSGWPYQSLLGTDNSRSVTKTWSESMYLAKSMDPNNANESPKLGHAAGAIGTLRIFDNSNWDNLYVGFIPNGYGITITGTTNSSYAFHQTAIDNKWETDVVSLPGVTTHKYAMGLATATEGVFVPCDHTKTAENIQKMGVTDVVGGSKVIYLKPNNNWKKDGARFAAYFYNNSGNIWRKMTDTDGDGIYQCERPDGYSTVIFCRMQGSVEADNWDNRWNQTGDITLPADDGLAKVYTINEDENNWGEYYDGTNLSPKYKQNGKFRIWDNSNNKNWYVHFIPYYLLSFDANKGKGTMAPIEYNTEDANNVVEVANCGFTRTGYDFVKWNTLANGSGTSYNVGANYTMTQDAKLYAQWNAQTYKITYKDKGNANFSGIHGTNYPTTHTYDKVTKLVSPTQVGYTFEGWYTNPECTGDPITQLGAQDYTADITLYASWTFAMEYGVTGSAFITSANGQTVKATNTLTLQVSNMPIGTTVAISAPNITFYNQAGNAVTSLTTTSNPESFNLTVAYTPTADKTKEQPTITLDVLNHKKTFTNLISCRSLPATFAIVTKVGNTWYALPSQGLNSKDALVGYPVEVDSPNDPTVVTNLPANADWSLRQVYVGQERDRFKQNGANIVLVNNEATAQALNASSSNNYLLTNAQYESYHNTTNPALYEWTPATTNLTTYQLTNAGRTDVKLSMNIKNIFGVHKQNVVTSDFRFLPINDPSRTTSFDMQVVEWYPTKVLVQTETALTSVSAIVGGEAVASPVVTNKGAKLYEISGLPLENNPTKVLTISYDTYSCSKVIPIIISRGEKTVVDAPFSTLTTSAYNYSDLVVRDGATLTINGTTQAPDKFVNVTIYPTAKIVVPENKQLSVYSLTFFGGISEIYNGSTYELNKYGVPQLSLKGTLGKTVTTIDYLMRVDLDQMYSLALPYNVALSDITYGDGTKITLGDALYVSAYDGQARANREKNTWIYETDFVSKLGAATLKAGVGYTISAEPQVAGDEYSILRMPMKSNISSGSTEDAKTINVVAYDNEKSVAITDNHKGWNLVGNPYMTTITGADDDNLVLGYLKEIGTGPWEWVEKNYRYVTIPSDNGEWYYQQKFTEAVLPPFKNFFVQIGTTGELAFGLSTRQNAPSRYLQQEQSPREVEFELLLSHDAQSDNTGLLISEEYTPAYEINADLEKMLGTMSVYSIYNGYQLAYNALSPLNAMEEIPLGYVVPATGEYSFTLDERGDFDQIEHIYLLDHEMNITTDLLDDIYSFTATDKKSDKRFAISVILKAEEEVETPTQLETLEWESDHPYKFIYQDKMYIMQNGVIYDAMGKQVQTINK